GQRHGPAPARGSEPAPPPLLRAGPSPPHRSGARAQPGPGRPIAPPAGAAGRSPLQARRGLSDRQRPGASPRSVGAGGGPRATLAFGAGGAPTSVIVEARSGRRSPPGLA